MAFFSKVRGQVVVFDQCLLGFGALFVEEVLSYEVDLRLYDVDRCC
jgi:hypothetical protein